MLGFFEALARPVDSEIQEPQGVPAKGSLRISGFSLVKECKLKKNATSPNKVLISAGRYNASCAGLLCSTTHDLLNEVC